MNAIAANVKTVHERMVAAAQRVSRDIDEITLVAVTKTHPVETVIEAYRAGLRHFGENRVSEALEKINGVSQQLGDQPDALRNDPPQWHLIGHLQSRQVGPALGRFALIHSVDSLKLAQRINRLSIRDGHPPAEVLLECNISGEASKYGFLLDQWETDTAQFRAFLDVVAQMRELEKVIIRGLMTMAPIVESPEAARPVFRKLATLREALRQEMPQIDWRHLSMGMTDDFEVAIEEGATMVRIGRALFGARPSA